MREKLKDKTRLLHILEAIDNLLNLPMESRLKNTNQIKFSVLLLSRI